MEQLTAGEYYSKVWLIENEGNTLSFDTFLFAEAYADHCEENAWVSVEERLPETNCDVLAAKKGGGIFQMSFHAPFDSGKRIFQWWGFGKWIDQHPQVTHWRPLPKNPGK